MCGWINQEEGDDFDWTLARGSDNFFTGPARDYYSFSREYPMGGYVYIDAGFPRRPGDRAYLSSPSFEPTGNTSSTLVILLREVQPNRYKKRDESDSTCDRGEREREKVRGRHMVEGFLKLELVNKNVI